MMGDSQRTAFGCWPIGRRCIQPWVAGSSKAGLGDRLKLVEFIQTSLPYIMGCSTPTNKKSYRFLNRLGRHPGAKPFIFHSLIINIRKSLYFCLPWALHPAEGWFQRSWGFSLLHWGDGQWNEERPMKWRKIRGAKWHDDDECTRDW